MTKNDLGSDYRTTDYTVCDAPGGAFTIHCGEISPQLEELLAGHPRPEWAYITAHNPCSQEPSELESVRRKQELESVRRMQELETRVRALGCDVYHGSGDATQGKAHSEPSLLVLGIDREQALEIATDYDQNAILVGRRHEPAELAWTLPLYLRRTLAVLKKVEQVEHWGSQLNTVDRASTRQVMSEVLSALTALAATMPEVR